MVDERTLLRSATAKREAGEGPIRDRWASYHVKTGALRCKACDFTVIKHERLWGPHTLSKSHRDHVRAFLEAEAQTEKAKQGSTEDEMVASSLEDTPSTLVPDSAPLKRKDTESDPTLPHDNKAMDTKRAKVEDNFDLEWAEFQRTVLTPAEQGMLKPSSTTISAEPELFDASQAQELTEKEESEAERRARLDRAAREDILARIEEEQQAQEEGEERYVFLFD